MEIFNPKNLKINFAGKFKLFFVGSMVLVGLSFLSLVYPGMTYGIDFRGGVDAQIGLKSGATADAKQIREALESKLPGLSVVNFDAGAGQAAFMITAQSESKEQVASIIREGLTPALGTEGEKWSLDKLDIVGRKVGADLRKSAILSLIYTCLLIALYVYWRFDIRYAPGALVTIFHDLAITAGFIVVTGMEFSTTLVAALLTLAGYTINDTVVIFDRIRETEGKLLGKSKTQIANEALNSTLSRTFLTAGTTFLSCIVLYFVGGPAIRDFAAVLGFGILVGTYSSLFIASPLYVWTDEYLNSKSAAAASPKAS